MLKPFSTGTLYAHEGKWKIMQDESLKYCQIRNPISILFPNVANSKNFPSVQPAAEALGLLNSKFYCSWNTKFNFSMTCPLIHYFKYLLRLQQCQMKDKSTMKQERQKEIKLLLKKNINPVQC